MIRILLVALFVTLAALGLEAQDPAFEVASIKPTTGTPLGKGGGPVPRGSGGVLTPVGNRFRALNITARTLIRFAYGSDGDLTTPAALEEYRLVGGPSWIDHEAYDVEARMPDTPRAMGDAARMTRGLLADRFGLAVHTETRDLPAYALVRTRAGQVGRAPVATDRRCGVRTGFNGLMGNCTTMAGVASQLGALTGRPVVDRTGYGDAFDFELRFTQDPTADARFPSIFTALEEQLGLRLERVRAPLQVIVIDRVERPTAN